VNKTLAKLEKEYKRVQESSLADPEKQEILDSIAQKARSEAAGAREGYVKIALFAVERGGYKKKELPGLLRNFKLEWPEKSFDAEVSPHRFVPEGSSKTQAAEHLERLKKTAIRISSTGPGEHSDGHIAESKVRDTGALQGVERAFIPREHMAMSLTAALLNAHKRGLIDKAGGRISDLFAGIEAAYRTDLNRRV
jgi:hypothetical protein